MFDKKFLKLLNLHIRLYTDVMDEFANTTSFTPKWNKKIFDIMKELISFGGEE